MVINRGMDKDDVGHIYNGILFSHKKEQDNAICSNVDGPRDGHTEVNSRKTNMISHEILEKMSLFTKQK